MGTTAYRTYGIAIAMTVLVMLAGCAGPFQSGGAQNATETVTETPTETPDTAATDETSEGTTNDTDESNASAAEGAISGRLLLLLDGSDTHVDPETTNESDGVWINESETHRWHVENESTTLSAALETLGINATEETVTYANETYDDETNGTTVAYRVDGEVVEDPDEYVLEDGDEVHVTTHSSNMTTPGREYSSSHPHSHGSLEATIDGEEVNFSQDRYTMNDEFFHFHGDEDASRWHAHSMNLTVSYAISAFDAFEVSNESVTYNGTTYDADRTTITVNDEEVDPDAYVLKDGDDIELVVEETD